MGIVEGGRAWNGVEAWKGCTISGASFDMLLTPSTGIESKEA